MDCPRSSLKLTIFKELKEWRLRGYHGEHVKERAAR